MMAAHQPGSFAANAAWLTCAAITHNLLRALGISNRSPARFPDRNATNRAGNRVVPAQEFTLLRADLPQADRVDADPDRLT
ncbi:hypothetical protein ACFLIM_46690 [Nonomuraea sp. M3C6]|uniref:Transposase DDE domain group 1 n=1 Tax=Nonomuraea marmarensis TaxID=3351344 RepID=A0ABW7ATC3_9ACTN